MLKTLARTIALPSISNQSLQNLTKQQLHNKGQERCYSKSKKLKKMLRTWEFTQEARDCQQRQESFKGEQQQQKRCLQQYRLISYNILAQDLLVEHYYLYQGINTQHLRWDYRLSCLRNELSYLDPDILCVQELQFNHVKEFIGRLGNKRKLEYVFKKKTGHRTDGCAIIYDMERFKLVAEQEIEFFRSPSNLLNRENIALMGKFQLCHEPDKYIVIGTTHLLFNPRRHDVRVAQVDMLLEALVRFARKPNTDDDTNSAYFPVILTGDFNSEPNTPPFIRLTSPYEILRLDDIETESSEQKEQDVVENCTFKTVSPRFKLSAIDFGRSCASTFHDRWITVDYILRSVIEDGNNGKNEKNEKTKETSNVKVLSIYKLPTTRNCECVGKIPNQYLGSDHYLQAIEFLVA